MPAIVFHEAVEPLSSELLSIVSSTEWSHAAAAVKRARILSRRLRVALDLFAAKQANREARRLDRATASLAPLRDLDAIAALVPVEFQGRLEHDRERLRRRAAARVTPERLAPLLDAVSAFKPFPADLEARLSAQRARVRKRAGQLVPDDFPSVHRYRRALRRLRYEMEALLPWLPDLKPQLKPIRKVLDELGAIADREAALTWLKIGSPDLEADLQARLAGVPMLLASFAV